MTDPTVDAVPDADLAEQSTPAYPSDDDYEPDPTVTATDHEAAEADLIEQAIPAPLPDDDYTEPAEPGY
ncbi:hypothetical protein [Nocardia alni]|uniref:hypothetical protein n=1 Tax=Nocardia alni TaxID=2815723 RepID=UPI001C22B59A|nr:hypothetical protein [Nocardia alni]